MSARHVAAQVQRQRPVHREREHSGAEREQHGSRLRNVGEEEPGLIRAGY